MSDSAYARSGVDITAGNRAVELMSSAVRSTYGPEVLLGIGAFGGLYDASRIRDMANPVLVASTDGVGTKTVVSSALGAWENLGRDIVNHCVNDILVQGAEPLFFLDYVASPKLTPESIAQVVSGIAAACREAGCALLGGETAEMPGVYLPGQMDIAGTIVGLVDRAAIIDGSTVRAGDQLVALPSAGLHTNGYSLVRSIFPQSSYNGYADRLGCSLGEALVRPHRSYLPVVRAIRETAEPHGLVHLTGGGFYENIPRILPEGLGVRIDRSAWTVPPLFGLIQEMGQVDPLEMYRVFNMGVGMVVIVAQDEVEAVQRAARTVMGEQAPVIGTVCEAGAGARVQL
ncbi:MAG: phosphoribosylformylglycinamidine cyclo-ligase [Anaerolineae bacterium]|jgi:phosphoribosylformylglycinamidine cyclo-ligase|nr:phosphoribosylformylglycinamidine cyclo-ligase [Chloroflexota bacterium]